MCLLGVGSVGLGDPLAWVLSFWLWSTVVAGAPAGFVIASLVLHAYVMHLMVAQLATGLDVSRFFGLV